MGKEFIDSIDKDKTILMTENLSVYYGKTKAVDKVTFSIPRKKIVALIGPSGCGKSTLIRCFNRMNDLIPSAKIEGDVKYNQTSIYSDKSDPTYIRFKIGMVFQKPNPFPKTIFENVAFGPRINGFKSNEIKNIVESSLQKAALWDEVKDRLGALGSLLSGGQQQRLTIARALSQNPEVLILDEFSIAIDPVTTMKIEDVLKELKKEMTIILVSNIVQQAKRLSDRTAFFLNGKCIEIGLTQNIFSGQTTDKRPFII